MCDTNDSGVIAEYRQPMPNCFATYPFTPHGQMTYLADSQQQFAWALYLDTSYSITDDLELSLNARFDSDHRKNTTDTPTAYLPCVPSPTCGTGVVRSHTWADFQPQAILRWTANDNLNVYASFSRGFRSGGFNQTGVAAAAALAGFDNVGERSVPSAPTPSKPASRAAGSTTA